MKKIVLVLLAASTVLTSCDLFNNYGKKVKINDKSTVYYKGDGVTEADAKKLGDYLAQNGTFDNKEEKAAQLTKDGDAFVVHLPMKADVFNKDKERYETMFWFWQDLISEGAFGGKKTKVILSDEQFKDVSVLDEMNKVAIGDANHVYFKGKGITEKEAKNLGDSLKVAKFFDYTTGDILLTKEKGVFAIRFLPNEAKQSENKESYNLGLSDYKYLISKYVLGGDDVNLYVIDMEFNDVQTVKMTSDDRKAYFDQIMKGESQTEYTSNEVPTTESESGSGN